MRPAVLLWDFGDTLVDERWMRRPPVDGSYPAWEAAWVEVMADLADAWNVGRVGSSDVHAALAERTGMSVDAVAAHARDCCERLVFNRTAWRVANERRMPQALVTVNPDLFDDLIVPVHGLTDIFDVIVTSSGERTADKVGLCVVAVERLGHRGPRSQALLIDNRLDLVGAWQDAGGAGYWFQGDEQFADDVPALLAE